MSKCEWQRGANQMSQSPGSETTFCALIVYRIPLLWVRFLGSSPSAFRCKSLCCSLVLNSTSEQHCSSIFSPIVPLCRIYSELCPVESVCVPCISRGTQGLSRYDRFWHETMARKTNDFENTQLTHASRPARSSLSRLMTK